jgi:hypothetical protein
VPTAAGASRSPPRVRSLSLSLSLAASTHSFGPSRKRRRRRGRARTWAGDAGTWWWPSSCIRREPPASYRQAIFSFANSERGWNNQQRLKALHLLYCGSASKNHVTHLRDAWLLGPTAGGRRSVTQRILAALRKARPPGESAPGERTGRSDAGLALMRVGAAATHRRRRRGRENGERARGACATAKNWSG